MRVAVIGAGWAGVACARSLHDKGHQVTLFESGRTAGGRARGVKAPWGPVDNGQHILLGAYEATFDLMQRLGLDPDRHFYRQDLDFRSLDRSFRFRVWPLPEPLHQLGVLLGGRGLSLTDRFLLLRFLTQLRAHDWQTPAAQTVEMLLQAHRQSAQLIEKLWQPLCIAALNTPIEQASARVFAAVLRDSLGQGRAGMALYIPLKDMTRLWVQTALNGIDYHPATTVRNLHIDAQQRVHLQGECFDACVIATQVPSALRLLEHTHIEIIPDPQEQARQAALKDCLRQFRFHPIATLYLQPEHPWDNPQPMQMLFEKRSALQSGQWVFNHHALPGSFARPTISVVISDAAHLKGQAKEKITAAIITQINSQLPFSVPPLPPIKDSLLITEQRATFLATPQLKRPAAQSPWPNVYFAADWVQSDYPAVLEAAVRSGLATAELIHNKTCASR